jgi:hypothetical protein
MMSHDDEVVVTFSLNVSLLQKSIYYYECAFSKSVLAYSLVHGR